eukprot:92056_1
MLPEILDLFDNGKRIAGSKAFILHFVYGGMHLDSLQLSCGMEKCELHYRHLQVNRTSEMIESLLKFIKDYRDVPYETNLLELVRCAYDGWGGTNKKDNLKALFCSEMVAKCYQDMGLLRPASDGGLV